MDDDDDGDGMTGDNNNDKDDGDDDNDGDGNGAIASKLIALAAQQSGFASSAMLRTLYQSWVILDILGVCDHVACT